jgi:serine/threonine protein phosphatase 1
MASLGVAQGNRKVVAEGVRTELGTKLMGFLSDLLSLCAIDGHVFVHAGLRPEVPLDRQDTNDLLWIRDEFLDHEAPFGPFVVVHGHTPTDGAPEVLPNRINIDTRAHKSGRLTAVRLTADGKVDFIQT